jgi:molybdopterin-guanine dinucleotide biosynthesis protein A
MGQRKESLAHAGETMLERTARAMARLTSEIFVVGSPIDPIGQLPAGCRLIQDEQAYQGPLAGLVRAWSVCQEEGRESQWTLVCPCDHPGVTSSFLEQLARHRTTDADAVAVASGDRLHPLPAIYHSNLFHAAVEQCRQPRSGLRHLLDIARVVAVPADAFRGVDPTLASLVSVDTPAAWEQWWQSGDTA